MAQKVDIDKHAPEFCNLTNLAEERLGAEALLCSDDFFAEMENLVKPGRGIFIEDKYTDRGKWMDGWESRRKRTPGYDWCILKLGLSGRLRGVDIDTNFFLGNHPPEASIEAICETPGISKVDLASSGKWEEVLEKVPLQPGSHNYFKVNHDKRFTHLRLNIYPDGGVARLKVYGDVHPDWDELFKQDHVELTSVVNGGRVVTCNDMFFSSKDNLIVPGRGVNMGDGWETKRRRTPGHDWVILKLAKPGQISEFEVDTCHFKGNYPDSCSIEGAFEPTCGDDGITGDNVEWFELAAKAKLQADHLHVIKCVDSKARVTHLRMNIFPDGGVSRFRAFGKFLSD